MLSCVLHYVIENCVLIEYLCCKSKKLSLLFSAKTFANMIYNELLGIGIPKLLMKLISCHGFTKNKN